MISIKLEGQELEEVPPQSSASSLAEKLHRNRPDQSIAVRVNGVLRDLSFPLSDGDVVEWIDFSMAEGREIFWHSSAHILAQAVLRLWPEAKLTIGPAIEEGFYYDFANLKISDADFERIEEEMAKVAKESHIPKREQIASKEAALTLFADNPYKCELIRALPGDAEISLYRHGEFFDLCRGPHIANFGKVKAIKLLKVAGAYWRGKSENEMLTRIYGISFPDRKQLKEYEERIAEAKKRDHKILGPQLDLFSLRPEGPGMPFIHPKGLFIWNQMVDYLRGLQRKAGYIEIKTPSMMTRDLWVQSGHWQNYRDNMYTCKIEDHEFAIKPMNCPGCMLFYNSSLHSYRELPLRIAEIGHVHRYEPHGALSGLFRVRSFHQDDAHIFMMPIQIQSEILNALKLADQLYKSFGLSYHLELSTRPESDTIGTDEEWELATNALRKALDESGNPYRINEGDGAFYGPKIDLHIRDALGRTWQCGTIQLDMALPERFDLDYIDHDGSRKRPVMIHRALYGSIERFFGSLIEFYAGKFPLWLSPRQVRILTIADRHLPYAQELMERFVGEGLQCELDDSGESISKKVRLAQLEKVNYMLTIGDKEVEGRSASLRTRDNVVHGEIDLDDFSRALHREIESRALTSPYSSSNSL